MSSKHTSATPAGVPRSRSRWTRAERKQIRRNWNEVADMQAAYAEMYGDDDDRDWDDDDGGVCPECDGEGFIVTCGDDLCVGRGECIRGDGNTTCELCGGLG